MIVSVNVWNVAEEDRVNQYMWLSWGGGWSKEGGHILFISPFGTYEMFHFVHVFTVE